MRRPDYTRRVVVTGLGVISPVGNDGRPPGRTSSTGGPASARSPSFDVTRYEHKLGGEVHDFDAADWMDAKAVRRSEPSMHFGVAAAKQALADSGLRDRRRQPDRGRRRVRLRRRRPDADDRQLRRRSRSAARARVAPTFIANALVDSLLGDDRDRDRRDRPQHLHRVGLRDRHPQRRRGRRGDPPRRLHRGHQRLDRGAAARGRPRRLREHARDGHRRGRASRSQTVSRPFDRPATASSSARAPASLFLEDLELAKARGAKIYAEVVGYGSAADGWDMIQPIEGGAGLGAGDEDGPRPARRARPTRST